MLPPGLVNNQNASPTALGQFGAVRGLPQLPGPIPRQAPISANQGAAGLANTVAIAPDDAARREALRRLLEQQAASQARIRTRV